MADSNDDSLSVPFRGRKVPVTYSLAVSRQHAEMVIASEPFQSWLQRCEKGNSKKRLEVHSIEIQSVDLFGPRYVFIDMF